MEERTERAQEIRSLVTTYHQTRNSWSYVLKHLKLLCTLTLHYIIATPHHVRVCVHELDRDSTHAAPCLTLAWWQCVRTWHALTHST
jgi:hypothetical protein